MSDKADTGDRLPDAIPEKPNSWNTRDLDTEAATGNVTIASKTFAPVSGDYKLEIHLDGTIKIEKL